MVRTLVTITLLVILTVSCGKSAGYAPGSAIDASNIPATICDKPTTPAQFLVFLNHTWVIAASYSKQAYNSNQLLTNMIFNMLFNGIDFTSLSNYTIAFTAGNYTISDSANRSLSFQLTFTQDFGSWHAGDVVPNNVFNQNSYISNFKIASLPPFNYSFTAGPLYGLIIGAPATVGSAASATTILSTKLALNKALIALTINSQNIYTATTAFLPDSDGQFKIVMTTTPVTLEDAQSQLANGGFGFSYNGSEYSSSSATLDQPFYQSQFLIKTDTVGAYWAGTYRSTLTKGSDIAYLSGQVSSRAPNTTDYYCDQDLTNKIGTLTFLIDSDGNSSIGAFVFADGTVVGTR